jgi:hypothetical protein
MSAPNNFVIIRNGAPVFDKEAYIAEHRKGKDAPDGWCHGCDTEPLMIFHYNDKDHKVCPVCQPTWVEDNMADDEEDDNEEEVQSWVCYSCCGYFNATETKYKERECCDNCAEKQDEEDDNESVHSTCCMDCDESFQFDEPVSAEDYADGNHEMRCTKCRAKHNGVQRYMTAFGRAPPDLIEPVMNACEDSILTAKQIVASLKATYPDITKTAVNSILYKALTKGLVVKHEHENAPPTWTWSE